MSLFLCNKINKPMNYFIFGSHIIYLDAGDLFFNIFKSQIQ